jgi:hypothetical protein
MTNFLLDKVKGAGAGTVDRIDENFNAARAATGFGIWKSKCIGLHIAIYGGVAFDNSGDLVQSGNYEFDGLPSTTYYLYIDNTTGLPTRATSAPSGWPDIGPDVALHDITTGTITVDWDNDWNEWKKSIASGGPQGPQGATGAQGATGSAGAQGVAGAQGTAGATGAQGAAGSTGAQGAVGSTGAQGAGGSTGAQGAVGAQGNQGPSGSSGIAVKAARVFHSTTQSLADNTETALTFDSESYDTDTIHDGGGAHPERLIATTAGKYIIEGAAEIEASAVGIRQLRVRLNGTTIIGQESQLTASAGTVSRLAINVPYDLAANDYVELLALQNSTGALNASGGLGATWFGMTRQADTGASGAQGAAGGAGAQGAAGAAGAQGSAGAAGAQGSAGSAGAQGAVGAQGAAGAGGASIWPALIFGG